MKSKSNYTTEKYELNPENIDLISERIMSICDTYKMDRKSAQRYRLSIEDSLLKWMDVEANQNKDVEFTVGRRLIKPYFKISLEGEALDPYTMDSDNREFGTAGKNMLENIGLVPEYIYKDAKNSLVFNIKRKEPNQLVLLLGIIAVAVIIGIAGYSLIASTYLETLSTELITPIEDTFFRILSSIAGPMIFLSVAWGVYGIGDLYTLGKIGKKLMLGFVSVIFLFVFFGCVFYPFLGPQITSDSYGGSQFSKIFELLLGIFPSNIFSPFVEGNTLQIIFLAFTIGLSMIFLGQRTSAVAMAVEQINHIITFLMGLVSKLVPFFVLIVLINIIWSKKLMMFSAVWKLAVVFVIASVLACILFLLYVSITCKKSPWFLFKSILPSYLIALSTASSSAAFETNINICSKKFNIKQELSSFGVPFGMVVFKPNTALFYVLVCFYFASVYNVNVSLSWIITAVVVTSLSAVATPPIPGGASATYMILFMQLGIPSQALELVLAIDMVFDFILTSSDMFMLLLSILRTSKKTGMTTLNDAKEIRHLKS